MLVRQLLAASNINPNDFVLEIGPGRGIITEHLVDSAKYVIAIEKDSELYNDLVLKFKNRPNLKLLNKDFLRSNLPNTDYKVFSNIPFDITAEIIDRFIKSPIKPQDLYLIMQQEAAEKYLDQETSTQSSILIKPFYSVEILGDIDRTSFTKKPQVNIVFVHFSLKKDFLIDSNLYQQFRDFVIYGFNQWQSNIAKSFKKIFSFNQLKFINQHLKINYLKPSKLTFNQWLDLFNVYITYVSPDKKNLVDGFERKYQNRIRVK